MPGNPADRTNVREESPRNAQGLEKKAQRMSEPSAKQKPAPGDKGAAQLIKNDRKREDK